MKRDQRVKPQKQNLLVFMLMSILWIFTRLGDSVLWVILNILKLAQALLFLTFALFRFLFKLLFQIIRFTFQLFTKTLASFTTVRWPYRPIPSPKIKAQIIFMIPLCFKVRYFLLGFLVTTFLFFLPTVFYFWLKELPSPYLLSSREIPQTTKIYDRSGRLLYAIYADENRTLVSLETIPDFLKKATIAVEDKDFYRHQGFNLQAIFRAAKKNLTQNSLQGGSTITQQLVKSALLTPEVTLRRKIKELALAFWAERIYSKDQILEMYLNQVPYGGTSWGVEAAAQTYFGKSVRDLNLAESALLAGLSAAPTTYSPFGAHPELAKVRQEEVLRQMVENSYLTFGEAQKAAEEKLSFISQRTDIKAPHFVMFIKEQLVKKYGERMVERGGLKVTTTLDLELQEKVQEILKKEIEGLVGLSVSNGAALVTKPSTGEILAMVGSHDYFDQKHDGNVNVTLSLRQPGSAIKVVNYAAALENGFTAATILDDSPVTYQIPGSPSYSPVNYDNRFHGKLPLRYALGNSYNVPAVKVLAKIGVEKMVETGRQIGITSWEDSSRFGLSLTLGGGDVTMLDLVKVYGVLASGGKKVDPESVLEIKNYRGEILEKGQPLPPNQILPQGVAFLLSHILADNQARSQAFSSQSALFIPGYTVSVKTGTTNDKRDNWTVGYTSSFVAAVWVGNNDNSPMNPTLTSGVTGAAPIWRKIMDLLLEGKLDEPLQKPEDVVEVKICSNNGLLPCEGCPTRVEYFLKGTEPKIACQATPAPEIEKKEEVKAPSENPEKNSTLEQVSERPKKEKKPNQFRF